MLNELNSNFAALIESYYTTVKSHNDEIIDINPEHLEYKIKIFSNLLEYYIQTLLYQQNIKLTEEEKNELRKKFDALIESYMALINSVNNNSIKISDTLLEHIIDERIAKKLTENKHNNEDVLEEIFNKISEQIERYIIDLLKEGKEQVKQKLLEQVTIKNPKIVIERIMSAQVLKEFINDLLLDKVNTYAIEEYLKKNSEDEIFESTLTKQLEKLYENYKRKLEDFAYQLSTVLIKKEV